MNQHNSSDKPAILIVEDDRQIQMAFGRFLSHKIEASILRAYTVEEGRALFEQHADRIQLIAMDGQVPSTEDMTTFALVLIIRAKGWKGPMIAMSNRSDVQERLIAAGCNDRVNDKARVPARILQLLQETPCASASPV